MMKFTITLAVLAVLVLATEQQKPDIDWSQFKNMNKEELTAFFEQFKNNNQATKSGRSYQRGRSGMNRDNGKPQRGGKPHGPQKLDCDSAETIAMISSKLENQNGTSHCDKMAEFRAKLDNIIGNFTNTETASDMRLFFDKLRVVKENITSTASQNIGDSEVFLNLTAEQIALLEQMDDSTNTCEEKEESWAQFVALDEQADEQAAAKLVCAHVAESMRISKPIMRDFFRTEKSFLSTLFKDPEARRLKKMFGAHLKM